MASEIKLHQPLKPSVAALSDPFTEDFLYLFVGLYCMVQNWMSLS